LGLLFEILYSIEGADFESGNIAQALYARMIGLDEEDIS
jgi:hypothetical protein